MINVLFPFVLYYRVLGVLDKALSIVAISAHSKFLFKPICFNLESVICDRFNKDN